MSDSFLKFEEVADLDSRGQGRAFLATDVTVVDGRRIHTLKIGGVAGTATIGGTLDAGPAWTTAFGVGGTRFTSADQSAGVAAVTSAPTTGQKLVITDIEISVDTAMRLDFKEETSGTVVATIYMAANTTVNLCTRSKRKLATANKKLMVQTSAAGNISVGAFYFSEA